MTAITRRNLRIFFRDKSTVFFSLLSLFIIIGLYVLFLGDTVTANLKDINNARFIMDSWIMAGLLAVTSITTTMGAFGIMVDDRSKKIIKDLVASPLSQKSLAAGYILSSYIIGVIISYIALALGEIYILSNGGSLLDANAFMKVSACILLSVLSSSSMVFFFVSFFSSQNAFATASTILGTLIGFLTGIYIPVGSLPETIQLIIKLFPVSHAGVLFRQIMMEAPMNGAFVNTAEMTAEEFKRELGVVFELGGHTITPLISVFILIVTAVLFYGLAILNVSRKQK